MRSSHKASGQSKAYFAQSDTLQRVGRRTHEAPSSGQRWIKDAVFSACLGNRFEQKACRFRMAGRWKTLSTEGGSTHNNIFCLPKAHMASQHVPAGARLGRNLISDASSRRRHLKLYMALVNGNVCIALCRFFCTHTHVFFNHREHTRSLFAPMQVHHVFPLNAVGAVRVSRLTALRAIFLIRWRARLLIVEMVLCILPLGARLARVAGRSSLQRMRFSEFILSLCVSFMCTFFCARSGCGAGANVSVPTCRFLRRTKTSRRHTQCARTLGGTYDALVGRWK